MSFAVISRSLAEPGGASPDGASSDGPSARKLIGRERELRWLLAGLRAAQRGATAIVAVEGAPGTGKSRLAQQARAAARELDMTVLTTRALAIDRGASYSLLRRLVAPAGADGVDGFAERMSTLALERPLLIAIDDIERSDRESLRAIATLALRLDQIGSVALLVTLGADTPHCSDAAALDALVRDPGAIRIRLGPLDRPAAAALVQDGLGVATGAPFAEAVQTVTCGNPFLICELVLSLAGRATSPDELRAGGLPTIAVPRVARWAKARAAELGRGAEALVDTIAVLGDDATVAASAAISGLGHSDAADLCGELATACVLASHDPPRFAQPLLRPSLYEAIAPRERLRLHGEGARALAQAGAPLDRIASHLLASAPGGDRWAARVLRTAARSFAAKGDPGAACACLRRAVGEGARELEAGLVRDLALLESDLGERDAGERLRLALELAATPREKAELGLALARLSAGVGDADCASAACGTALRELELDDDRSLRMRLSAELIAASPLRGELSVGGTAAPASDPEDLSAGERLILAVQATAAIRLAEPRAQAVEVAKRALAGTSLFSERGSLIPHQAVGVLETAEHLHEAKAIWDTALATCMRRGLSSAAAAILAWRARTSLWLGDLASAIADGRAAIDQLRGVRGPSYVRACTTLAEALIEIGEIDAAEELLDELHDAPGAFDPAAALARARARMALQRYGDALAELEAAGSKLRSAGVTNPALAPWRSLAAECHLALGRRARARELATEELTLARSFGAPAAQARVLRTLAGLGDGEEALTSLREAVSLLEESPVQLELARALIDLGAALVRAGEGAVARDHLRRAMSIAHRLGANALSAEARDALIAAGGRPRRPIHDGLDGLTRTELRVAELAAGGRTNREIGEELFVTVNTVSTHLRSVYRKLGIRSRGQLPARMTSAGQPPETSNEIGAT